MTTESFWSVVRPKAVGSQAFSTAGMPLLTELLFSSTSAIWSQPGAGHYAAANALLDASAAEQHTAGVPATAVQFGPFGGVGMAAEHGDALAAIGLRALQPSEVSMHAQQRICEAGYNNSRDRRHAANTTDGRQYQGQS